MFFNYIKKYLDYIKKNSNSLNTILPEFIEEIKKIKNLVI